MAEPPTLAVVAHHQDAHGGLWRVVPPVRGGVQPWPAFVLLTIEVGRRGQFVSWNKGAEPGDVLADDANRHLRGAVWIPVDATGERIA